MPGLGENPELVINVIGHLSGVVVFANFLYLVLRRVPGGPASSSRYAIWAGSLALLWNLASLTVLAIPAAPDLAAAAIATIGFCSLSFLPAVLLSVSMEGRGSPLPRWGYVLSFIAMVAHAAELAGGSEGLHRLGLGLITVGFGLLTVFAVFADRGSGRSPLRSRLLAAMPLFLFAVSFVHFSDGDSHQAWSTELAVHHAGIPLALFILIQDYRFVLLDAYLRFLAHGLLAGLFAVGLVALLPQFDTTGQIILACAMLAGFALLRGWTLGLLTRIVFRQQDPGSAVEELRELAAEASSQEAYWEPAIQRMARAMDAEVIALDAEVLLNEGVVLGDSSRPAIPVLAEELPDARVLLDHGIAAVVPVRLPNAAPRLVFLSQRQGARRYLSQDLETLSRLAATISTQAERLREIELERLASQAELRALQAQIHPHFLFNALNTLYGIIPREASRARSTLLNLSEMLRYFLRSDQSFLPLEEELRIIRAYLAIESLRLGDKLKVAIDVDEESGRCLIPILSVEPLVENAVKHGIGPLAEGGQVRVEARREAEGLRIRVIDSGRGFAGDLNGEKSSGPDHHFGIGLDNVRRRLELCYGTSSELEVRSGPEGTVVGFLVPQEAMPSKQAPETSQAV